jgi:transaldolase/glucose-6-phosphate isomerase
MPENPLLKLKSLGQSVWLDYIRRQMLTSGELARLINEDGLGGVTSNPAIFDQAIAGSHDYDADIQALALAGKSPGEIYEALTVADVQQAADVFRPLYEGLQGQDGFVSLEVTPHLAHDTAGTIAAARRLWGRLSRPNVFIKVPATLAGLPAIKQLISEGINVNVTLLFALPRYRQMAEAYIDGLEDRAGKGLPLAGVASVASFFLSRIDVLVDPLLEQVAAAGGPQARAAAALQGEVAMACAKVAYQTFREIFGSVRFRRLVGRGAFPQRLLWASTGTKNPRYPDVKYVEPLIGPGTINTMPLETLNAYRDHGDPQSRLEEDLDRAASVLQRLPELGLDLRRLTQQLEDEGVEKFIRPYDSLMATLEDKRQAALREPVPRQVMDLGEAAAPVKERLARLEQEEFCPRLWRKDPSLWTGDPKVQKAVKNALGWLHGAEKMEKDLLGLLAFPHEVMGAGFRHVVHMGMGGSSLAPLAFQRIFFPGAYGLPFTVLDTTDPATILRIKRQLPLAETLFIVASKSGTTAEPLAFGEYFYHQVRALKGDKAGRNFVVITDPGTPLAQQAHERGYRRIFYNFADIGGRYSALSYFGLVPGALMGLEVPELLARALRMTHACFSCVPAQENPGLVLGAVLGELARRGRDKVTVLVPDALAPLGMWLEQLLAESTGKEGTGLVPVTGEPLGAPDGYGPDRLFVYLKLPDAADAALEQGLATLRDEGHPVVTVILSDRLDLGQEFFRWEVATAAAGAILGINPFDQPNVQESKDNTNRLLALVKEQGRLPEEAPSLTEGPLSLYGTAAGPSAATALTRFLGPARPGDYVALLAYLTEDAVTEQALAALRLKLRDGLKLATTVGYGPRYLHSTGQLHKGGPNTGLFLLLTADEAEDVSIPEEPYTFGIFKRAQALGDLEALRRHGRRVVRVHLGADPVQGLTALDQAVAGTLAGGRA